MKNKIVVLMFCSAGILSADVVTFNITDGNPGISGYPGPYASVSINLTDPTHAGVTFNSLSSGIYTYLMGSEGAAGLNVNSSAFTVGPVTELNSLGGPFAATFDSFIGPGNEDGLGDYDFRLKNFDGFFHSATEISFVLTNTSGTWGSASDVLTPNAAGNEAAAHIFVQGCLAPNGAQQACNTGYGAGNGSSTDGSVPEPGSIFLFGSGILGATALFRRKKQE